MNARTADRYSNETFGKEKRLRAAVRQLIESFFVGSGAKPDIRDCAGRADDLNHGTDWLVHIQGRRDIRIAVRMRDAGFVRYSDEFTVKESRATGTKTELQKIRDRDWADFYLYGFMDFEIGVVIGWSLFDMRLFNVRAAYSYIPQTDNRDTTARLYRVADQPTGFVVASTLVHSQVLDRFCTVSEDGSDLGWLAEEVEILRLKHAWLFEPGAGVLDEPELDI